MTAPDDAAALHLEDVGEVAAKRDFEVEANRPAAVVGDVDVLVHAAADVAAEREAEDARLDRSALGEEGAVGLEDTRTVIGDRTAIKQIPGLAVGEQAPAADHAGVEEVEALVARPCDLAVRLAHQHRLALVDGNLRRSDLDLERHGVTSFRTRHIPQTGLTSPELVRRAQDCRETRARVEARPAQPVDRAVATDQSCCFAVPDHRIVFDPQCHLGS